MKPKSIQLFRKHRDMLKPSNATQPHRLNITIPLEPETCRCRSLLTSAKGREKTRGPCHHHQGRGPQRLRARPRQVSCPGDFGEATGNCEFRCLPGQLLLQDVLGRKPPLSSDHTSPFPAGRESPTVGQGFHRLGGAYSHKQTYGSSLKWSPWAGSK